MRSHSRVRTYFLIEQKRLTYRTIAISYLQEQQVHVDFVNNKVTAVFLRYVLLIHKRN
jgi:hypothetical protein